MIGGLAAHFRESRGGPCIFCEQKMEFGWYISYNKEKIADVGKTYSPSFMTCQSTAGEK